MHLLFRTYLAALHHNANAGRPQAVTKDRKLQWAIKYPKARKGPVISARKTEGTYGICPCSFLCKIRANS